MFTCLNVGCMHALINFAQKYFEDLAKLHQSRKFTEFKYAPQKTNYMALGKDNISINV